MHIYPIDKYPRSSSFAMRGSSRMRLRSFVDLWLTRGDLKLSDDCKSPSGLHRAMMYSKDPGWTTAYWSEIEWIVSRH